MGTFISPEWQEVSVNLQLLGEHSLKAAAAAGAVGAKMGLSLEEITIGMAKIRAVPGRMNILRGVNGSTLIDDSYNSSPMAIAAALKTLYMVDATQRVAILGSMNEFGELSPKAHDAVGKLCDPHFLDWVVTVGDDAEKYLAPAATGKGCQVRSFKSPYDAGGFVHSVLKKGGVVLVKGSQNGVFTEEATKVLLHDATDEAQLVRQSPAWMDKKDALFMRTINTNEEV
jgi:UDP-N-acetylmuramoyl-tripeptide--D-alanyl-D-alanine ligase